VRKKAGRQASGRATLAPVPRCKGGKTFYVARGSTPVREADGRLSSRRVERGFGPDCTTEAERHAQCARWNADYEERFRNPRKLITFAKAYSTYIKAGNPLPYYATKILIELGEMQCSDIDDASILEAAEELWPDGAAPGTINRHLYTPVLAVLHMALKEKAPELARPAGHNEVQAVLIPPENWYRDLAPQLNRNQFAFVMCMAMHGRRTREMLGRRPADLDVDRGILDLGKTKTGVRQLDVHPGALRLLLAMPSWQEREWLFGAGPNSADSFRRDLKAACERAGLPWYHPHSFGRHTSVTRMLRAGYSVAHVADAHGMTPEMVTRRYGHLTRKESTAALHVVGGELLNSVIGGNAGERALIDASNFGDKCLASRRKLPARTAPECLPSEGSTLSS
jgi:integrase